MLTIDTLSYVANNIVSHLMRGIMHWIADNTSRKQYQYQWFRSIAVQVLMQPRIKYGFTVAHCSYV